jgi:hypothetical protein
MAGIMVYIPGGGTKTDFPRLGLASLFDPGVAVLPFDEATGPDGGSGSFVVFDNPTFPSNTPRAYEAATQTWRPAARDGELPADRYFVGYVTANRPCPEELQRQFLFDGEPVPLDDKQQWILPVADFLPQRVERDRGTGSEKLVPKDEHAEFVELANATYELFLSEGFSVMLGQNRVVIPDAYRLATLAIQKNYRVNSDVIDLLGLFDQLTLVEVALAVTGIKLTARALEQKKSAQVADSP